MYGKLCCTYWVVLSKDIMGFFCDIFVTFMILCILKNFFPSFFLSLLLSFVLSFFPFLPCFLVLWCPLSFVHGWLCERSVAFLWAAGVRLPQIFPVTSHQRQPRSASPVSSGQMRAWGWGHGGSWCLSASLHLCIKKSNGEATPLFVFSHCIQTNEENHYFLSLLLS